MTEADILALTYQDSCWVYRPQKTTLPSGESVFQKGLDGRQVYENIPCALSSPSGGKLGKKEPTASIDTDFLLFVRPGGGDRAWGHGEGDPAGPGVPDGGRACGSAALPQQCAAEAGEGESMSRTEYRFDGLDALEQQLSRMI